ncbi:signal peptidase I [Laceyella putida]|uniref:Signal peptidase I n=1 Tax=Laceyella putida TaxID=110101 RepID=A0ABW2RFU0_9BACL
MYIVIGLAGLALGLRLFFGLYQVQGDGMEPTLKNQGFYLVMSRPLTLKKGDIVVFRTNTGKPLIRRVIGLPNQTVEIKKSKVYVDGKLLHEPYVTRAEGIGDTEVVNIPENHYYLLSDDRADTWDSRRMGTIHQNQLLGKFIH